MEKRKTEAMDTDYVNNGKWWVSPFNYRREVLSDLKIKPEVKIHDATLRDGEQTPGVVFSSREKIQIASMLLEAGVDRIEAGMPAVSEEDRIAIKEICRIHPQAEIFSFVRANIEDIKKSVDCGVKGVVIEIPIGYPKLIKQFKWTWEDVLEKSINCINFAKENELYTVFFPYDTTRARFEDLDSLISGIMANSPPDSIGIVDTMGCATPRAISFLTGYVKEHTNIPVEIHCHNEFGMAVASEFSAYEAGAEVLHSCVNGLGERTGNGPTEEIMAGLQIIYGIKQKYDLKKILDVCEYVGKLTNIPVARNKPICGDGIFVRESGIGIDLVRKDPLAMYSIAPEYLGKKGKIVLGKKSGKLSISYMLEDLGIEGVNSDAIELITKDVKEKGVKSKRLLTNDEFLAIVSSYLG